MRFLNRSFLAIVITSLTLSLLMIAAGNIFRAAEERAERDERRRPAAERVYAAEVAPVVLGPADPVITTFGEVESWRTLEIRAAVGGRIVDMTDSFRDGGAVKSGDVLVSIDPADMQTGLDIAEAQLREAEAERDEADAALELARLELEAAEGQVRIQDQALERQRGLRDRGVGSETAVETADLAATSARQTVLARRQALAQAESRIARADISVTRAKISRDEALRHLEDTQILAPFDGVLSDVVAVQGRLVGANEKLATLLDPAALEVAFRVSSAQYTRLLDEAGNLRRIPVEIAVNLGGARVTATADIARAGADVGEGQTGRLIYAGINPSTAGLLKQGDFVEVAVVEPQLQDVAIIPATAATSDGRMLFLADDDRLEEIQVAILRRQGAVLIVDGAPEGREFVTKRQPQLGAGIKVKPARPTEGFEERQMVRLAPERKAALIAAIQGNSRMPSQARDRLLGQLEKEEVPADVVARIEERMGLGAVRAREPAQAGGAAAVALDADRRARLVSFVESNTRMPSDVKARILAQLQEEEVPEDLIQRLESRMGG